MEQYLLAVIGAGEAALPIINKAKSIGVKTLVFGQNGSLAQDISDIFIDNDIFDIDGVYNHCKENKVNGVIASSEISTEVAAKIAAKLGLPGNDVEKGFAGRNKYEMRCRVSTVNSVKQPLFELYDDKKKYPFPIMVKAVDSCGKQGVSLVKTEDDFQEAIEYAQKYSSNGNVLIEHYLEGGQEYSVECIAFKGFSWIIQITQKDTTGAPHFVEIGHHQPAILSNEIKQKIEIAAKDILEVLGITCGMAHLEIKIINNDIYFIEVGARAGGGHIGDTLIALSTGYDYYRAAIECSLGVYEHRENLFNNYAGIYYYCDFTKSLKSMFVKSLDSTWCFDNNIKNLANTSPKNSSERTEYFIYCSDRKINKENYSSSDCCAIEINALPNAYQLVWNHWKEIGRNLNDDEMNSGIKKFLNQGHLICVVNNNRILAFLNLYCNNYDSLEAYVCNIYVLEEFRRLGLFAVIFKKAISMCKDKGFRTLALHVREDNFRAVEIYKKNGFVFTGNKKVLEGGEMLEMVLNL